MDLLNLLLRSKEFWAALILVLAAAANWLLPNVPKEVISAFLALLATIAGILAGQQVGRQFKQMRTVKKFNPKWPPH